MENNPKIPHMKPEDPRMLFCGRDTIYDVIGKHHKCINDAIDHLNKGLGNIEEDICANDMAAAEALTAADDARNAAENAKGIVDEVSEFMDNLDKSKVEAWDEIHKATTDVSTLVTESNSKIDGMIGDIYDRINRGEFKGDDGNSFVLHGQYESYDDFIKAHPTGVVGEAYSVLEYGDYNVYFWDRMKAGWSNIGPMKGPKGDKGDRGDIGLQGPAGKDGKDGTVTFEALTPEQKATLKGEKGEKGDPFRYSDFTPAQLLAIKGDKGDKGEDGADGKDGRDGIVTGEIGGMPFAIMTEAQYSDLTDEAKANNNIYFLTEEEEAEEEAET